MNRSSQLAASASRFSPSVRQGLNLYALSASAAGVALLALAQPANAEIIYHPTDVTLFRGSLPIDLNGDGTIDFTLYDTILKQISPFPSRFNFSDQLILNGEVGASVIVQSRNQAQALSYGVTIGSGDNFVNANTQRVLMAYVDRFGCGSSCGGHRESGPWLSARNMYLGLKFDISGQVHYGWARITTISNTKHAQIRATLTGYAYETVANQSIKAGQTSGTSSDASAPVIPEDGTLAALARGKAK